MDEQVKWPIVHEILDQVDYDDQVPLDLLGVIEPPVVVVIPHPSGREHS